jgi:hypothetical protein
MVLLLIQYCTCNQAPAEAHLTSEPGSGHGVMMGHGCSCCYVDVGGLVMVVVLTGVLTTTPRPGTAGSNTATGGYCSTSRD